MTRSAEEAAAPASVASTARNSRAVMRARLADAFAGNLRIVPVLLVLVVLGGVFALLTPFFLTPRNITFLLLQTVPTGVLSLSLIFVLFVAEVDLSLAAVSALASALAATLLVIVGVPATVAVIVAIAVGCLIGAFQAGIVLWFGAPSFLVTLGTSFVLTGLLTLVLPEKSAQISILGTPLAALQDAYMDPWLSWAAFAVGMAIDVTLRLAHYRGLKAQGLAANQMRQVILPSAAIAIGIGLTIWHLNLYRGVPWTVALFVLLLAGLAYVTSQTAFGRHIFAVGGNREAARRAGVRVDAVVVAAFSIAGGLAATAGLASTIRQLSVSASSGGGLLLLSAIAGAVIGGASLFGGRGTVWAALLGPLIIATISNGFDLLAAPPYLRIISIGTILVLAVILDSIVVRGRISARGAR